MGMSRAVISIVLLLSAVTSAQAWSRQGHAVIAIIAESNLSPTARRQVLAILATEGSRTMADVASWADAIRKMKLPVQPLHAVWIPKDAARYVPSRDCPQYGCAVSSIDYSVEVLSSLTANEQEKLIALKYLVHMVGDIHQPFHAIEAKGRIFAGKKKMSLHKIWDQIITRYPGLPTGELAKFVDASEVAPNIFGGAEQWAWESHVIARDVIIPAAASFRFERPAKLPKDYAQKNWPIAAKRLKAAGMRLAWTLNEIYAK
jgi:hypothetical protein